MKHTDSVDRIFNTNIKKKKKHWRKIKLTSPPGKKKSLNYTNINYL